MDWKTIAKQHGYDTKQPICKFDISKLLYQMRKDELDNYFNLLPVEIINYMIDELLYIHYEMQSFESDISIYYYTSEHSIEYYIYIIDDKDYYIISVKNINECEFNILFSTTGIEGVIQFYTECLNMNLGEVILIIIQHKNGFNVMKNKQVYLRLLFKL